jgi:hypothetical protein
VSEWLRLLKDTYKRLLEACKNYVDNITTEEANTTIVNPYEFYSQNGAGSQYINLNGTIHLKRIGNTCISYFNTTDNWNASLIKPTNYTVDTNEYNTTRTAFIPFGFRPEYNVKAQVLYHDFNNPAMFMYNPNGTLGFSMPSTNIPNGEGHLRISNSFWYTSDPFPSPPKKK